MIELKKIRVVGDGTQAGTRVYDADTGEPIKLIQKIEFKVEAGRAVTLARVTTLAKVVQCDLDSIVDGEVSVSVKNGGE